MLKVMIVGCGGISSAHIEGYLQFGEQCVIIALADTSMGRMDSLTEKYNLKAEKLTDYRQGLAQADIVSVCTPPLTHHEISVNALNAGCHVLLEKPMAPSLAECDAILNAAEKAGKLVSVVAQSRFITSIRNVIRLVQREVYGKLRYARIHSAWYRGESYYDLKWRGRWEVEGGGCTLNHSIHHIDLLLWAKGLPQTIRSSMMNLGHSNSEEEDFSSSFLVYDDGCAAEITSSLISHGEPQLLRFQMEHAGLDLPFQAYASSSRENGFPMPDAEQKARVEKDFYAMPVMEHENHAGQIGNFLAAIAGREDLISSGLDGRNAIELITGIYKSAMTGKTVAFPIKTDDVFYDGSWRKEAIHFHEKSKDIDAFADTFVTSFKGKY